MKLLSEKEKMELKNHISGMVGNIIRTKREQKNISGEMLGKCLGVSSGMVSQYESGKADISLFKMALASTYCGFPMTEYFDKAASGEMLDIFSNLVQIEGDKYKRHKKRHDSTLFAERVLTGKIYNVNGQEVVEYLPMLTQPFEEIQSAKQRYLYGEIYLSNVEPFTEKEFVNYLNKEENVDVCRIIGATGDILHYLGTSTQKERFKSGLAEFILTELIINKAVSGDADAKRAYMYYRDLIAKETNDWQ